MGILYRFICGKKEELCGTFYISEKHNCTKRSITIINEQYTKDKCLLYISYKDLNILSYEPEKMHKENKTVYIKKIYYKAWNNY